MITSNKLTEIADEFETLRSLLPVPIKTKRDYAVAIDVVNVILDTIGDNEKHPLADVLDFLSIYVARYEQEHHTIPDVSGGEMLRYFMDEHNLRQTDLPEVGKQSVVSQVLAGKRMLNVKQMQGLSDRFRVSPATFFPAVV